MSNPVVTFTQMPLAPAPRVSCWCRLLGIALVLLVDVVIVWVVVWLAP